MTCGKRALPLAVLVLALSASTGCGALDEYAGWRKAPDRYVPLTESTMADAMTLAMFRHETLRMEMEIAHETMSMDVDLGDADNPAMAGTYDDGESVGTMVLVDGEVYYRDEGNATYFQFPDHLADQVFAQVEMSNPKEMANDFRTGIDTVTYGGFKEVTYGPAHRYDVTMRKEFMADELNMPVERVPEFSYVMWLDQENVLRRLQVTYGEGIAADVTFTNWGEPVDIQAPPPRRVEPLPLPTDQA